MNSNSYRGDHVWSVENKTTRILFTTERAAYDYMRSFPPSISGGMFVAKIPVFDAASRGATSSEA
jgi:hypothetical protein